MILEVPASLVLSQAVITRGSSETAQFVTERAEQGRRQLQSSNAIGLRSVFNELCEVADECTSPNWDGYDAAPVSDETYRSACRFLEALPVGTPAPSVGAEPDGHLTFEWHRGPRRTLSVSVDPEDELHFAALIGHTKDYGTQPFFGEIPERIFRLIQRVSAG
jgi:hypothetical protein